MTASEGSRSLIVVGVDGTPSARHALQWALDEGQRWEADVEAVAAWHALAPGWYPDHPVPEGPTVPQLEVVAQQVLDASCHAALGTRPIMARRLRRLVEEGPPAKVLLDRAAHADLLVVGRRGYRPAGPRLGSVSDACARQATCPVAVVPLADRAGTSCVVVGVDGSPQSGQALVWAAAEAGRRHARLEVVKAVGRRGPVDDGRRDLLDWIDRVLGRHAREVVVSVPAELAVPALLDAAAHADLVVVGSGGRGPVRSLVLGSTSRVVVHQAPCTVVLVPEGATPPET